ncbi:MAG: putative addiction module antidote protein [Alphaproteobacteria bacterium]|nr:putative addiction module antidote protein [Alphaproteobacteria bacterium]
METETKPFDELDYLKSEEDITAYMSEALATNEPALIAYALGVVARARGMSRVARDTGLSRETLHRALSADGNPELATVLRIVAALGLRLTAESVSKAA